jgi:hypothetical protein
MKAIKAIYENGEIKLAEPAPDPGPVEVLVVFPEPSDDPWQAILNDASPRPALAHAVQEVLDEIAQGKTETMDLNRL